MLHTRLPRLKASRLRLAGGIGAKKADVTLVDRRVRAYSCDQCQDNSVRSFSGVAVTEERCPLPMCGFGPESGRPARTSFNTAPILCYRTSRRPMTTWRILHIHYQRPPCSTIRLRYDLKNRFLCTKIKLVHELRSPSIFETICIRNCRLISARDLRHRCSVILVTCDGTPASYG